MPFSPATEAWFSERVGAPTPVQAQGWPIIASGQNALLLAPTGSGKTLAAFLWSIDRLAQRPEGSGVRVLYVSPLKALVYDVRRNLQAPLQGVQEAATRLGQPFRPVRAAVRTGDTPTRERRALLKDPPEILVTTPESLFLLLGSAARERLRTVETIIVDEVHTLVPGKRGAHLAISLERLAALCPKDPQRVGLSATMRPPELAARFLCGDRPCAVVDTSAPPNLDLSLRVPVPDLRRPWDRPGVHSIPGDGEARSIWPAIVPELVAEIQKHRSTLIFVNSRGLAERLAQRIDAQAGEPLALAHHGSLSHGRRRQVEEALKEGRLRAMVATSSMELGIDMGAVDCVLLVESPGSVARGLQRAGRAGHGVGQRSRAILFPKFTGDLIECAALAERMRDAAIEPIALPQSPLDVLSQQLVAMAAQQAFTAEQALALLRRSGSYQQLSPKVLDACLAMLCGDSLPPRAGLHPRLFRDEDLYLARRGAGLISSLNVGTIPDRGLFGVYMPGSPHRLGELDEEMVYESRAGQVFVLGASSWRIESIQKDRVLVTPAPGQPGRLPFWKGDSPGRPAALGQAIGAFVRELSALPEDAARARLTQGKLDTWAIDNLLRALKEQAALSALPHDRCLVLERHRDELGEWRVCLLSPYGARVHAPLALAMESLLVQRRGVAPQSSVSDDGIALRLPDLADPSELPRAADLLPLADDLRPLAVSALRYSPLFAARFREIATRALLLPRQGARKRSPLWAQRQRAQDLLAASLDSPEFPLLAEAWRECLQDLFDLDAATQLLRAVERGEVQVIDIERDRPSPFARSLSFAWVAQFMYDGETPQAERRAQALRLDPELLRELMGESALAQLIPAPLIQDLRAELDGRRDPARDPAELLDLLRRIGDLSEAELAPRISSPDALQGLLSAKGAIWIHISGESRLIPVDQAALYRDAAGAMLPPELNPAPVPQALPTLVERFAARGPFSAQAFGRRYALPSGAVDLALSALEQAGTLQQLDLGEGPCWVDTRLLRRLRRRALAQAQGEMAPADAATFTRAAHRRLVQEDLDEALASLEGVPLPLSELEQRALPARLGSFDPRDLDERLLSGAWVWLGAGLSPSREGQVMLLRRERAAALYSPSEQPIEDPVQRLLLSRLRSGGACFFTELQSALGRPVGLLEALWDLVWRGLISNDSLAPARALTAPRRGLAVGGRWWLTEALFTHPPSAEQAALWRVEAMLSRHGLVCREAVDPAWSGGFAALGPALRLLEDRGRLQRGVFVVDISPPQLLPPGAVDALREARQGSTQAIVLPALDPAQPYGALLPWPGGAEGPRRVAGARVVLVGGAPVLWVSAGRAISFPAEPAVYREAAKALARSARRGPSLELAEIDGQPATAWSGAAALVEQGFVPEGRSLRKVVL